jgi:hypothetical protein
MPRSKKTRTRSTDRAAPRHARRLQQVRMGVAAEAARIIATEGQHNYHAAKKKAAERMGVSERLALPSNVEVKDALYRYIDLYGGVAHRENLRELRETAARAMHLLDRFAPRLVGSVLDGTAGRHSRIALHVFAESSEALILFFLERSIPFSQEQRQIRWFNGGHRVLEVVVTEFEDRSVELSVFEPVHLRQAPPSPIDGRPQRRATLAELELLLAERSA